MMGGKVLDFEAIYEKIVSDERYKDVLERLAKVEEGLLNVTKRVDEVYQLE